MLYNTVHFLDKQPTTTLAAHRLLLVGAQSATRVDILQKSGPEIPWNSYFLLDDYKMGRFFVYLHF